MIRRVIEIYKERERDGVIEEDRETGRDRKIFLFIKSFAN